MTQKWNETDEEYEKRKKRVKASYRMLGMGGGYTVDIAYTNCFSALAESGTVYGFIDSVLGVGTLSPTTTSDGTYIYQFSWDTSDGSFIMAFGVAGNEALDNTLLIIASFTDGNVELHWDATNLYYAGTNTVLAGELAARAGTEVCYEALAIPDLLVDISFEQLEEQV